MAMTQLIKQLARCLVKWQDEPNLTIVDDVLNQPLIDLDLCVRGACLPHFREPTAHLLFVRHHGHSERFLGGQLQDLRPRSKALRTVNALDKFVRCASAHAANRTARFGVC
jgi:hypothetical protein